MKRSHLALAIWCAGVTAYVLLEGRIAIGVLGVAATAWNTLWAAHYRAEEIWGK